ncbi:MATE family efflux transporter [Clostridiaceae bacterium UIB06]|nr:MATE family efflux transporter [Clostridiaceae bacterium UIB06]
MEMNDRIFINEKITNILIKFSIPSIISLLVSELYNTINTVFVGHYIGPNAIAALTVAFPIQRFLTSLGLLIAVGASTYVSRSLGEKNSFQIRKTIINSFAISLIFMLIIPLTILIFKSSLIYKLGASNVTYALTDKYIVIILLGSVFQCLATVACYIMTSLGNTRVTLYANSIGAILNVIINYILVANYEIGIIGSAIATVVSQIISFTFVFYNFREVFKHFEIKLSINSITADLNKGIIKDIMSIGFSTFIIEVSDAIVAVVLNNLLISIGGDTAIIVIGVVTRISMFMFIAIIGISSAMQPIVAFNFGAGELNKVKEIVLISIKSVTIISVVFAALLTLFSNEVIGFFLNDKEILYLAVKALRICVSLLPLVGVYYIVIYYYQAIGEAKKGFLLSIFRQLVAFIPLALMLVQILGAIGAWIAYPVSDAISVLLSLYLLNRTLKKEVSPGKETKINVLNNRESCLE